MPPKKKGKKKKEEGEEKVVEAFPNAELVEAQLEINTLNERLTDA
jgi:hypothetical protein